MIVITEIDGYDCTNGIESITYDTQYIPESPDDLLSFEDLKAKYKGKYVIKYKSNRNGKWIYMQDRTKSKARWWTYFLCDAIKFTSKKEAQKTLNKLKYNNPKIYVIN